MEAANSIQEYISKCGKWKEAVLLLREIVVSEDVTETVKWGAPAYTVDGKNIIGLAAFKSYVGLWFHQGALLADKKKKLINAQEGVTKALRQWRFHSPEEIMDQRDAVRDYVREAIANQKMGKSIRPARKAPVVLPEELKTFLEQEVRVKKIFDSFPPSHQREYAGYIAEAKRPETRQRRLVKIKSMILDGVGLNDKYKK